MKRISQAFLAGLLLIAAVALAEPSESQEPQSRVFREGSTWVEELKGTLPAARMLHLRSTVGSVEVKGGNQNEIRYVIAKRVHKSSEAAARKDFENFRVIVGKRGDTAFFEGNTRNHSLNHFSADFHISVPRAMDAVRVETFGGNVAVNNIAGKVNADTAGGDMRMDAVGGPLSASTQGGNIDVGSAENEVMLRTAGGSINVKSAGGVIDAHTSGGSIDIGNGRRDVKVQTAGGNITVKNCQGTLRAATAGGSIEVGDVGGEAAMESAGGAIRLGSARGKVLARTMAGGIRLARLSKGAQARTAAGGIEVQFIFSPAGFSESTLETMVGDITVSLPEGMRLSLRAGINSASGHKIHSDFSEIRINSENPGYGPRELFAEGNLNGGGPALRMHTTSGDIEILRNKN